MIIALFNTNSKLSDEELITKFRESDNNWWLGELYKRYSLAIAGICFNYLKNKEEAEDAAMDIFELLHKDLKKYEVRSFRSWLPGVVRHHCLKIKDKNLKVIKENDSYKKEHVLFVEIGEELGLTNGEPDLEKLMEHIQLGLDSLNEEQKICIELFYLKDHSYKEIIEITGMDDNKVKSHIQNGKRNLKIFLEQSVNKMER